MSKKVALISGITGQDGSFLAEFLIEKGYEVHGILRRSSSFNTARIEHLYLDEWVRDMKQNRLVNLHWGDMTDSSSLIRIIQSVQPDEIYNLAAQSHVKVSFDVPEYTAEADAVGTLRMLEAVRILGLEKKTKIYQASTSELFGLVQEVPQKETTPFYPRSPYGVAKQYGFWITKNYRESYGMFAVNGILFNHESERRGETFVTRKITLAAARIAQGFQDKLYLGNLTDIQLYIYEQCPHDELTIIMRRYMMRIAEHFAKETKCLGLITGESIGQVASQTMQSLAATNEVCTLPVFRPVIAFDKQEIVDISEKIGAFETSILPYEDCCTIFVAKHPVTKPNIKIIKRSEQHLNEKIDELMKTAIDTVETIWIE